MRKIKIFITVLFLFVIYWNVGAQNQYGIDPNDIVPAAVFPQLGHSDDVNAVFFSPDGRQIISSDGKTIKLWNAASGREIRSFTDTSNWVTSIALSPDGKYIVSSGGKIIKLWYLASGREIKDFIGHRGNVKAVAFSPNGRQIVSCSHDWNPSDRSNIDNTIRIWDVASGREIIIIESHSESVNSVAFSPDGIRIVSGSSDKTIKLWDASTGREIRTFSGHSESVNSVAFSPDGKFIVSGSGSFFRSFYDEPENNTIKLWDAFTGHEIGTITGHQEGVNAVIFSPDGKQIISGSNDKTIKIFDASNGREIRTISGHQGSVNSIVFSPDGRQIASGSEDSTIKLWNVTTGREVRTLSGYQNKISSIAFSPNSRQVVSGLKDGTLKQWDITTGREIRSLTGHTFPVNSVAFSPDGRQIISGATDDTGKLWREQLESTVKLWDTNSGRERRTFSRLDIISSLMFSPDGKQILVSTRNNQNTSAGGGFSYDIFIPTIGTIKLYDTVTGREISDFTIKEGQMDNVTFSPDGRYILTSNRESLILLNVSTGNEVWTYTNPAGWVNSVAFSTDGSQILASFRNTIKLWEFSTGRDIWTFTDNSERLKSASFSSDGKQIYTISDTGTKLWDITTRSEIKTITSVFFNVRSSDNRRAASISSNGTMILHDISTGKEIAQFINFIDGEWVIITPDGYYNTSPNGDKYLNVRTGNNVYGIDRYRNTYYKPQIIEARLQGRPDPVR